MIHPISILLLIVHISAGMTPGAFVSFYDFARSGSASGSSDLVGSGPTLPGGSLVPNGISISFSAWQTNVPASSLVSSPYSGISFLAAISPAETREQPRFLHAAVLGDSARQQIVCGMFPAPPPVMSMAPPPPAGADRGKGPKWRLGCYDGNRTEWSACNISMPFNHTTVIGIRYGSYNRKVRLIAYVQSTDQPIMTCMLTSTLITFTGFFSQSTLTFTPPSGSIYYFGYLAEVALTLTTFSGFSGGAAAGNKAIVCQNCLSESGLTCNQSSRLAMILGVTREYYCTCPEAFGFEPRLGKCVAVLPQASCGLPCPLGCNVGNRTMCRDSCPEDMYEAGTMGEFVGCVCTDGQTFNDSLRTCSRSNGTAESYACSDKGAIKDNGIGTIIIAVIVVTVVVPFCVFIIMTSVLVCRRYCCRTATTSQQASPAAAAPNAPEFKPENIRLSGECKICFRPEMRLVAMFPCGHAAVCEECVKKIAACPFDRERIQEWIVITPELRAQIERVAVPEAPAALPMAVLPTAAAAATTESEKKGEPETKEKETDRGEALTTECRMISTERK